jgi:hypothetical protein
MTAGPQRVLSHFLILEAKSENPVSKIQWLTDLKIPEKANLTFPLCAFGLCSCGFLVYPLGKCLQFKSFGIHKTPIMF